MTDIKGKYFPVGHGLTYGFKLNDYHILFDIAKPKNMGKILNDLSDFYGDKSIDILSLSHFHVDHVAGIGDLIKYGFQIKQIFIPYIQADQKIIINLSYISSIVKTRKQMNRNKNSDENIIIQELFSKYNGFDITKDLLFEKELLKLFSDNDKQIDIHHIGNQEVSDNSLPTMTVKNWEFHYMNSDCFDNSKLSRFYNELASHNIHKLQDLQEALENDYKNIIMVYEKVFKNLNLTSMFLVHGPIDPNVIMQTNFEGSPYLNNPSFHFDEKNKYHSFVSGDMDLRKYTNQKKLNRYENKIKYALVPHHSSTTSWSDILCKKNKDILWVVTIGNIGVRPYGKVVKEIYDNNQEIYICDKSKSFEYEFIID